jgi:AraC-like DNA-binding protein
MSVVDESMRTDDVGEAERLMQSVYPVARIRESRRPFSFGQHARGDDRAVLVRFDVASWIEVHVDFRDMIGFGSVRGGAYRASSNGEALDTTAPFLFQPGTSRGQAERLDLLMINFDEPALARFAGGLQDVERPRLRYGGSGPLTSAGAELWTQSVRYAEEAFSAPEILRSELIRRSVVDMLFAAALTAFPIEAVGDGPTGAADDALPSTVRRALAFIDEHLDQPIGIEEIAEAARLSVRGLQSAFRRHLGTTPRAALRSARLAAAHADLLRAEAGRDDVASIARRWGFHHLGRFAAEHRAAYGEPPRRTLQR